MKISQLIQTLSDMQNEHGDLTCAEELPLGFMAIRDVETKVVPKHRAVHGVADFLGGANLHAKVGKKMELRIG